MANRSRYSFRYCLNLKRPRAGKPETSHLLRIFQLGTKPAQKDAIDKTEIRGVNMSHLFASRRQMSHELIPDPLRGVERYAMQGDIDVKRTLLLELDSKLQHLQSACNKVTSTLIRIRKVLSRTPVQQSTVRRIPLRLVWTRPMVQPPNPPVCSSFLGFVPFPVCVEENTLVQCRSQ